MKFEKQIKILDKLVADQIAAGEVIERPGSVVKELLENSIDAGATRITLEVDFGGGQRIRIFDNGHGIHASEVQLAFVRHATSKIQKFDDLSRVETFGFRGEALPSIASVSRMEIRTRIKESEVGSRLVIEGGNASEITETGCPVGTDIEVKDLFFNVPARKKFLKSQSTENSHCAEALVRLALMHPEIAFVMKTNARTVRNMPRAQNQISRVSDLFKGEKLAQSFYEDTGITVTVILGAPDRARAGSSSLYTYINGRFIRDASILKAVNQGFARILEPGRYPVGLISLVMPPNSFDVNVHPQKTQVRFNNTSHVFRSVARAVTDLAAGSPWIHTREQSLVSESSFKESTKTTFEQKSHTGLESYENNRPDSSPGKFIAPPKLGTDELHDARKFKKENYKTAFKPGQSSLFDIKSEIFSNLNFIGQAQETFLLFESEDSLVIMDQHAAHERVTFEKLKSEYTSGKIASQKLLISHQVDLGPEEAERVVGFAEKLEKLGLEISRSGPDSISIHAVPALVADTSPDRLLADIILSIEESGEKSMGESYENVLVSMACHGSIRAGKQITPPVAEALAKKMENTDYAGYCPHGRPVMTKIPWHEIKRRVGRN